MIDELSLEELDERIEMQSLTHDIMLKNLFERNEYLLRRFLISVLHLNIRPNECKVHFLNKEIPVTNCYEYKKALDFNVSINDHIFVNIELNKSVSHYLETKQVLKRGQSIKDIVKYTNIQLNLNAYDKSNNLGEDIIVPYSIKTDSIYVDNDVIYLEYLDYYYHLYYNENIKKEESDYWLAMLMAKNFTELNDILSQFLSDNLRKKIVNDVYHLSIDEFVLEDIDRETLAAIELRDSLMYSKEEGIQEGIEQNSIDVVKAMLNKKMSYDDISDISGKSIEEIKKIEKSL